MSTKISFLISLHIESQDRLNNLDTSIDYIKHNFPDSEIVLSELDVSSKIKNRYPNCLHVFTETDAFFNRQRGVNIAVAHTDNKIISLYDADVLIKPSAINKAAILINDNIIDVCYPYNGYFYDVPMSFHDDIQKHKTITNVDVKQCKLMHSSSVGGVVMFDRQVFVDGGKANEKFQGVGYEDNELFERFRKLNYRIGRIDAPLFHLTHERKETSYDYNPYDNENRAEYIRILNMSKEELLQEIKTW